MFLRELASPLSELKGAGPVLVRKLERLGLFSAADLLLHAPRDYEDRSIKRLLGEFSQGPVNCQATVLTHDWFGYGRMRTLKIWVEDEQGTRAGLVCFNRPFLERSLPVGARISLFGRFEYRFGELQSSAFEAEQVDALPAADGIPADSAPAGVLPVYPLTDGVPQGVMRKLTARALARWSMVDDELPPALMQRRTLLRKAKGFQRKILESLILRSKLEKRMSTYCLGTPKLLEHMQWEHSLLHPSINQCVAITGRLSETKPNLQNQDSEMRICFPSRF